MKLACKQVNATTAPARIVYMKATFVGLLPFEGRDKYQDGHGSMLIKLLKLFTVADAKGKEMDGSGLVTVQQKPYWYPAIFFKSTLYGHL